MDHEQLKQMIEACRPGSDDLREPEMAALADHLARHPEAAVTYERSQHFDASLAAAFRDVPVPTDLEERILAAVGAASRQQEEQAPAPAVAPRKRQRRSRFSRRVVAGSLVATCLAILVVTAFNFFIQPQEVTPSELVAQTLDELHDVDFGNPAAWKQSTADAPHLFPSQFINGTPEAWRVIDTDLDSRAVVYRIPVRNKRAYLFVISTKAVSSGLGGAPSPSSLPGATGGWKMTAWRTGKLIYVLAFEDSLRALLLSRPTA